MEFKIKYKIIWWIGIFQFFISPTIFAQQQIQQSQFLYNTNAINPAFAGYNDRINFILSHRMQWVGLEGAPLTQTFSFGMPLANNKINIGGLITNESIGAKGLSSLLGNFSYYIHLPDGYLSFGIRGGLMNWRVKRGELNYHDTNDPASLANSSNSMVATFDAGFTFAKKGFLMGVSSFNLNQPTFFNSGIASNDFNQLKIHLFGYIGYRFNLNSNLKLRTTALVKYVENAPINIEGNVALIIKDKFHTAITYRSSGMIGIMAQMYVNDKIHFGYSFDYTLTNLKNYAPIGTHEVFLGYNIFQKTKPMVTPRFL